MTACLYCGEEWRMELAEFWPEDHAWDFDTCCEGAYHDACAHAEEDPKGFSQWLEAQTGWTARRTYVDALDTRIDFGLTHAEISQAEAKAFVREHHRHCPPPAGWRWGHAVFNGPTLVAVAMVGRPVARKLADRCTCLRHGGEARMPTKAAQAAGAEVPRCDVCGEPMVVEAVEVNRLCVDPTLPTELAWNACSMLYGAVCREAKTRKFARVVTYTMAHESGASLAASGWTATTATSGGSWDCASRPREDKSPTSAKTRWERGLTKPARRRVQAAALVARDVQ